jgi:tricorn protease-like protein
MNDDAAVTANFIQIFVLSTSASPSEGGTLSPSGANGYIFGAQVPVTASPNSGYTFSNWSGDCTGSGSCLVTMDSDKNVAAVFNAIPTPAPGPATTEGIVFVSTRDAGNEIYMMNDDGTDVIQLTRTDGDNLYPSWSADGSKIAFTSTRDADWEIYTMSSDGINQTRLTTESGQDQMPTWSPDGAKIAFLRLGEIYVMNADGSGNRQLTDVADVCVNPGNCSIWDPDWSPDGSKIAFRSAYSGDSEIYTVNVGGTNLVNLTNTAGSDTGPSWSPDGTKLAFSSDRDGNSEVYVMNSDGSEQTRITNNSANDSSPVWSPDGSKIGFSSNRDGDWEIYTMLSNGTSQINISTNGAFDGQLDWGP